MPELTIKNRTIDIEPYEPLAGAPFAIIVDLDGTLAHRKTRSPYDYTKVIEDTCDVVIADLVRMYRSIDYRIIISTGRNYSCAQDTIKWLDAYDIPFDLLLMRSDKDKENGQQLPDWVVKYNLFNERIRNRFNVQVAIDDRDQVVRLWRTLGIKCLQVDYGDF